MPDILLIRTAHLANVHNAFPNLARLDVAHLTPQPIIVQTTPTAYIFTSPNGVSAAHSVSQVPVYAVGENTAKAAKNAGWHVVHTGTGHSSNLAEDMRQLNLPSAYFVHIHGDLAEKGWYTILEKAGHTIESHIGFTTQFLPAFSESQKKQIEQAETLAFFSKQATQHFCKLAKNIDLSHKQALCISPAVASVVQPHVKNVQIAKTPNAAGMQAML